MTYHLLLDQKLSKLRKLHKYYQNPNIVDERF